ncbi:MULTISPECIES: hypothetical protein [Burkholderia]|uniref:hypothetical protein n=1 Tax=Burkholderia TaxID=32008 RepID=UPI001F104345|nr:MULTISPECIES: hypothetical protein [Burkholderia]
MKNTVRVPIFVLALILAAPAFATTPADNIAWSAQACAAVRHAPGVLCLLEAADFER